MAGNDSGDGQSAADVAELPRRAWRGAVGDRTEQFEVKRQVVLLTAARIFSQRGFYQTTLTDVAEALHIAKPTLYHYFKSKDEILLEIQQVAISQITDDSAPNTPRDVRTGRDELKAFVRRYVDMIIDDFGTCLIKVGVMPLQPDNQSIVRAGSKHIESMMRDILRRGVADKSIPPCDPKITAMFVFGAMNWIPHWYRRENEVDADGLKDMAIEFVLTRLDVRD